MKKIIIFIITLFFLTISSKANDRDDQLNRLFNELKINNLALVYGTEQKIWEI